MNRREFLKRFRTDWMFRARAKKAGIYVIQDNVIFCNPDGSLKAVINNNDRLTTV